MSQKEYDTDNPIALVLQATPKKLEKWINNLPPEMLKNFDKKILQLQELSKAQLDMLSEFEKAIDVFVTELANKGATKEQINLLMSSFSMHKKPKQTTTIKEKATPPTSPLSTKVESKKNTPK